MDDDLPVRVARARWRAAEDRLYPSLLADPTSYQRSMSAMQAVVAELRRRAVDAPGLVEAESVAEELVATVCPAGTPVPAQLLVAVGCAMVDRELTAEREQRRRTDALDAARAAGEQWAVVDGPDRPEDLTEGRRVIVHLASGAVVQATVDPWAQDGAYGVDVTLGAVGGGSAGVTPEEQSFAERGAWLAELDRVRGRIEADHSADAS